MEVVKLKNKNIMLVANEGKIIQSKATHFDEELQEDVADISGETIYLGIHNKAENYEEVQKGEEECLNL